MTSIKVLITNLNETHSRVVNENKRLKGKNDDFERQIQDFMKQVSQLKISNKNNRNKIEIRL